MNIKRWYNNQSFFRKVIYIYLLCAAMPMFLVTLYNYQQTRAILMEQVYSDMQQNVNTMKSGIDLMLQPYETMTRTLESDRTLNLLLNTDYSNQSYSDLVYYCHTTLDNLLALHPQINWLRFYSDNETLPENNYYFYRLDQLNQEAVNLADNHKGITIATGNALKSSGDELILIARINYYASSVFKDYLVLSIQKSAVMKQIYQEREGWNVSILDMQRITLVSTIQSESGHNFLLGKKKKMFPADQIQIEFDDDGIGFMCLRTDLNMGMSLLMTVDQNHLLRHTKEIPMRALAGFLLVTLLAFMIAFMHSRVQSKRLGEILGVTRKIGEGHFDCALEDMGKDEFGQIASAVNQMNGQISNLIQENYERKLKMKISEMNLLQEQINPHFLYNALSVISSVALRERGKQTVQSVRHLADFYRMSLSKGRNIITVQEEVELLQNYMKIQMLRFSDTLEIHYEIDPAVASRHTIKLILQPLVENAIHHGRQEDKLLQIYVRSGIVGGRLFYEVEDNGVGIEPEKLEKLRTEMTASQEGFGLKNVDIRIKLQYGEQYGVQVFSTLGDGTTVHVEIPGTEQQP